MLINHFHVFPEGVADEKNPKVGTLDEVMDIVDQFGKETMGVAFAPHTEGGNPLDTYMARRIEPNEWLYQELKKYPRVHGFVTVNPKDRHAIDIVRQYIKLGFKGVKMHNSMFRLNYDDPDLDVFYNEVAGLNVPIYFHTGPFPNATVYSSMPITLDKLAYKYPRLKIIIGHLGGRAFFNQTWAMLQAYDNCYAELANTLRKDQPYHISQNSLIDMVDFFGSKRIIYGCDTPWPIGRAGESVREDVETIESWPISDKEKDDILGDTLKTVLGL